MITSELNKKAWAIRKAAAAKFNCPVMEIAWGLCLKAAKNSSLDVGDIVSVTMKYAIQESYIENGVFNVKTVGYDIKEIADRIEIINGNSIYVKKCRWVGINQISPASEKQIIEIEKETQRIENMLANGHRLAHSLNEPEYI